MTNTRCKCGIQTNYGMTCVRCRQEIYRSRYAPTPKVEKEEEAVPVPETEKEEDETQD